MLRTYILKLKSLLQYILQKTLGFQDYLFLFSLFKINTLKFDAKERDFLLFCNSIKGKGVILDIGANIGIMTALLSKRFTDSTIIAIEPIPYNISALKRVISYLNLKNVKIMETALGSSDGEVEMVLPLQGGVKKQGLSHVVDDKNSSVGEKFKVAIARLDGLTSSFPDNVIAIKLDVENHEYEVLDGGKALIQESRPVIYTELWDNENRVKCIELLAELNYLPYIYVSGEPVQYDSGIHDTQNFLFLPN